MRRLLGWSFAFLVSACNTLPYRDDIGFLVSAQANSHEFPVRVNGSVCRDMKNLPGACTIRVRSDEPIVFRFDPMPYAYQFNARCTTGVDVPPGASVPPDQVYTWTIQPDAFRDFRSIACVGEILPQDRPAPVSASWRVTILVVDAAYEKREGAYITEDNGKKYLVLGQYARMAWVFDLGRWVRYSQKTIVELKGKPEDVRAYSESYAMRYNYLNLFSVP